MTYKYDTIDNAIDRAERDFEEGVRRLYTSNGTRLYGAEATEEAVEELRARHASEMARLGKHARERVDELTSKKEAEEARPLETHLLPSQRARVPGELALARAALAGLDIRDEDALHAAVGYVVEHGGGAQRYAFRAVLGERLRDFKEQRRNQQRPGTRAVVIPPPGVKAALAALEYQIRGESHARSLKGLDEEIRKTGDALLRSSYLKGAPGSKSLVESYHRRRGGFHEPKTTEFPTGDRGGRVHIAGGAAG